MGPTSPTLAWTLAAVAVVVPVLLAVGLWRARADATGPRRVAGALAVLVLAVTAQLATVGAAAVAIDGATGLYPTWGDVEALAQGPGDGDAVIPVDAPAVLTPQQQEAVRSTGWALFRVQPRPGEGQYREYLVPGPVGRAPLPVVVWVPPGYERARRFPGLRTVYLYDAAYGNVDWFVRAVRPAASAAPLVRSHALPPFLVVAPEINVAAPMDTECTDDPGGPQAYTWLARDVPAWAHATLGLPQDAAHVSAAGWSVGGYCAAKVHAASPGTVGAAASVQGFFQVEDDRTTGDLTAQLRAHPALRARADVARLLAASGRTPHLLVVTSRADPQSYPASMRFLRAVGRRPGVASAVYGSAGHSVTAWRGLQADLWRFLVARTPWPARLVTL